MLSKGARVQGKWTGHTLLVDRPLGAGANGEVYLVHGPFGRAAMKVCANAADVAMEWGLLERLSANSRVFPKPLFIDDAPPNLYFYVMEWVQGVPFHRAYPRLAPAERRRAVEAVLHGLAQLHRLDYGFCDIKPENILVADGGAAVRLVDVGGVTSFGRSVRQYTPFYDRAFWGLGGRRADAHYDLCGFALNVLFTMEPPPDALMAKTPEQRQTWLWKVLRKHPDADLRHVMERVLRSEVQDAAGWLRASRTGVQPQRRATASTHAPNRRTTHHRGSVQHTPSSQSSGGRRPPRRGAKMDWTERLMWTSLGTAAMVTIAAWISFLGGF